VAERYADGLANERELSEVRHAHWVYEIGHSRRDLRFWQVEKSD
jgi:hypothetical protein